MKVEYDRTALRALIVSPTAWTATPPLRWFDNYCIISIDSHAALGAKMRTYGISQYVKADEAVPKTVNAIYNSPALQRLLVDEGLDKHVHIMNRPHEGRDKYPAFSNKLEVCKNYENKAWFRRNFSQKVRMPRYEIIALSEYDPAITYERLTGMLSNKLVIQHPALTGSRGTYFAASANELDAVIAQLKAEEDHVTDEVVISECLSPVNERSLQMCVLSDKVLIGSPQAQLIRHPLLTLNAPGAIQFCGGRIGTGLMSDDEYEQASRYASIIGEALRSEGYRGIFGVDFLITDQVYVLEVNPRFTGLSPLLACLQNEAPFMLLHVLEYSKQPYRLYGENANDGEGSFITVYAQHDGVLDLETGLYDDAFRKIGDGFTGANLLPSSSNNYFVATRVKRNENVQPGKSLVFIYSRTKLFDTNGELTPEAVNIVSHVRARFTKG